MRGKRFGVILIVVIMMLHGPVGGLAWQTLASVSSYVSVVTGSLFNATLRADLQAINYNLFNGDVDQVLLARIRTKT